jgi:DNA-directed RNA polymerase subunit beta
VHIEKERDRGRDDTKLASEKITRDNPTFVPSALRALDEDGIVPVGRRGQAGDILVGKTSFKGESEPTPEERLLRSIFGEKAREVKDTSLRVRSGEGGIVVKTVRFRRGDEGVDLKPGVREMVRVYVAQKRRLQVGDKVANRHGNKGGRVQDPSPGGHALPARRYPRRSRVQPAGRALAHEPRADPRDAPR